MSVENLRIGYGSTDILSIDSIDIECRGVTGLLGPSGCGKSSLLRALAGLDEHNAAFWVEGDLWLKDSTISNAKPQQILEKEILLLQQQARFYGGLTYDCFFDSSELRFSSKDQKLKSIEKLTRYWGLWSVFKSEIERPVMELSLGFHKLIYVLRLLEKKPRIILLDEPFRGFALSEEPLLIDLVRLIKKSIGVVLVTHNKDYARRFCDQIILISGGRLIESGSAKLFFKAPNTQLGRRFLETGSAWPSKAEKKQFEKVSPSTESQLTRIKKTMPKLACFYWVIPWHIGGMQKPGLLSDLSQDIKILQEIRVDYLITLTEKELDLDNISSGHIKILHFPIKDMGAPNIEEAYLFLFDLTKALDRGQSAIFHCKAGIGRTGTMLACCLVMKGRNPADSIEKVRSVFHRYIQSEEQVKFIYDFHDYVKSIS